MGRGASLAPLQTEVGALDPKDRAWVAQPWPHCSRPTYHYWINKASKLVQHKLRSKEDDSHRGSGAGGRSRQRLGRARRLRWPGCPHVGRWGLGLLWRRDVGLGVLSLWKQTIKGSFSLFSAHKSDGSWYRKQLSCEGSRQPTKG